MPSAARPKSRPLDLDPAEFDLETLDGLPVPQDPAIAAALLLLNRALSAVGVSLGDASEDGSVCLILAPTAWTEAVRDTWKAAGRRGERYADGAEFRSWSNGAWVAWAPTEAPSRRGRDDGAFEKALWKGKHVLGVASDDAWLPPDLVAAADHRLELPVLTVADVAAVARELCHDTVTSAVPDDLAAASLTPRVLRLARRPGQGADEFVRKVLEILARDAATAAAATATAEKASPPSPRETPTLDRLHGMDEAVAWGLTVARDLLDYREGRLAWADVDRGCLLSGPPGCGKTLFARALAASCGATLVTGSYGQWLGSGQGHQGDLLKAMKQTFALARSSAPSILFIDEVDSFPNRATITHAWADWEIQVVNSLLAEIDGVEGREGVVLLAACNMPDKLDPALVRSGRLDRHLRIGLPDRAGLARILREHLGADLPDFDLSGAALAAGGSSGADCERLVRGARRRARAAGRAMFAEDLLEEIGGTSDRTAAETWVAAVHEAGHAVAACRLQPGTLRAISLRETEGAGGHMLLRPLSTYAAASEIRDRLIVVLAARAAEEVILGAPSSGAGGGPGSDLAFATNLAAVCVAALGFGDGAGLTWLGLPDQCSLPGMMSSNPGLAEAVGRILADAYGDALKLVAEVRPMVEDVARQLVKRKVLDGETVAAIVGWHERGQKQGRKVTRGVVDAQTRAARQALMTAAAAETRRALAAIRAAYLASEVAFEEGRDGEVEEGGQGSLPEDG